MSEPDYILLGEWAARKISPTPSAWTLRQMVRSGKIDPQPVKIGKAYYVRPDSQIVATARPTLLQRLRRA
jgi:hypothetical protein